MSQLFASVVKNVVSKNPEVSYASINMLEVTCLNVFVSPLKSMVELT